MVSRVPAITDSPAGPLPETSWQGAGVQLTTVPRPRLLRVAVVVAEVLAALILAGLAWWCWHRGVIVTVRRGVAMNRIDGRWWAIATGVATLAGILILDAGRQVRNFANHASALSP
jgi:TRAP-type C4-dicarboxylate transport system permease small subunit